VARLGPGHPAAPGRSTSLTTIALAPEGGHTYLTYTEQGVHFDGLDSPEGREDGARKLLGQLGAYLAPTAPEDFHSRHGAQRLPRCPTVRLA
jgi:hypothetical protein